MSAGGKGVPHWWFKWSLAAALMAVAALRGAQLATLSDVGFFIKYTAAADAILDGTPPLERLPDLSPGYLWFVTAVRAACGRSFETLRTVQVIALGLTALLCAALAWRLGGRVAGIAAGAALLALRAPLVSASEAEPESLMALLLAAALWLLLVPGEHGQWRLAAGGLALGLAAATRPTALAVALVLTVWVAAEELRPVRPGERARRRALGVALAVASGIALPVLTVAAVSLTLTGSATIMNPGTVFYEGMNPAATGYLGEAPRVVKEVERTLEEPDALHAAYRQVAQAAAVHPLLPAAVNRYWTARAAAFASTHPGAAARLLLRKALLALHSHESWDLATMERKDRELARWPWLSFGALAALAAAGALLRRRLPQVVPLAAVAGTTWVIMVVFYVSSRQRCAALPALAVLAGLGIAALLDLWRSRRRRLAAAATCAVATIALLLGLDGRVQREDRHGWGAALAAADARAQVARAADPAERRRWLIAADLWAPSRAPETGTEVLRPAILGALSLAGSAPRRFDLALAASRCGDWATADGVLATLDAAGYRPLRGAAVTPSVAYYRARCALRLGRPGEVAPLVTRALREAPGDPWVLALAALTCRSAVSPQEWERELACLHDPLTADLAIARAAADTGDHGRAQSRVDRVATALPALRHSLPDLLW